MTVNIEAQSVTPSRRALLVGAFGGIAAWAASTVAGPKAAQANDPNDVLLGGGNTASTLTWIHNTANSNNVFEAESTSGGTAVSASSVSGNGVTGISGSAFGLWGASTSSYGVYGQSQSGIGTRGSSTSHIGLLGLTNATDQPAIRGQNTANSTAIMGFSALTPPSVKTKTGVYGYANQDANAKGVYGDSPKGYAGYFNGRVYTTKFYELTEISNPAAPTTNRARLFVRDNGAGKTQLCVRFEFGAVQVIATQP